MENVSSLKYTNEEDAEKNPEVYGLTPAGVMVFVLLYFLAAFCLSRMAVAEEKNAPDLAVYIKTNGVHTDIVVPGKTARIDRSKKIKFSNTHLTDTTAAWLGIGWGDNGFCLKTPEWSQLKFSVAFRAACARSTTAMHATFYHNVTEDKSCRKIMISNDH